MIKNELKSIFRDRKNLIYIIVFTIMSAMLSISLNMKNIINNHYDNKINEYIEIANQSLKEEDIDEYWKRKINYQELIRTVQPMSKISDEQKNELKKMKHVQEIRCEEIKTITKTVKVNYIIVDDWKNRESVQKYLNSQGINSWVDSMAIEDKFFENYKIITNFSDFIKYIIIIISIVVLIVCCKNIIKNEKKNYELLKILGYKKNNIRFITFTQLAALVLIGSICGYIIYMLMSGIIKIVI